MANDRDEKMLAEFCRMQSAYEAAERNKFRGIRDKLCDVLSERGVERVIAEFDGEGDDGGIVSIAYTPATEDIGKTLIPGTEAERWGYDANNQWCRTQRCQTLHEAIDDMCHSLLSSTHPGWEINAGSCGSITMDVASRKCKLAISQRYVDYDESEEEL